MKYLKNVTTLWYDSAKCTGCQRCTEVCPRGVFIMQDVRAAITDKDLCIECGACMNNCAFGAIAVKQGVGCAAAVVYGWLTGTQPRCECSSDNDKSSGCC